MKSILFLFFLFISKSVVADCGEPSTAFVKAQILKCEAAKYVFEDTSTDKNTISLFIRVNNGFETNNGFNYDSLTQTKLLGESFWVVYTPNSISSCRALESLKDRRVQLDLYLSEACCDNPPNGSIACKYDGFWADDFDYITSPAKRKVPSGDFSEKYDF